MTKLKKVKNLFLTWLLFMLVDCKPKYTDLYELLSRSFNVMHTRIVDINFCCRTLPTHIMRGNLRFMIR